MYRALKEGMAGLRRRIYPVGSVTTHQPSWPPSIQQWLFHAISAESTLATFPLLSVMSTSGVEMGETDTTAILEDPLADALLVQGTPRTAFVVWLCQKLHRFGEITEMSTSQSMSFLLAIVESMSAFGLEREDLSTLPISISILVQEVLEIVRYATMQSTTDVSNVSAKVFALVGNYTHNTYFGSLTRVVGRKDLAALQGNISAKGPNIIHVSPVHKIFSIYGSSFLIMIIDKTCLLG